ncbi:uncharacterized protein LOC119276140 isoform X2 [Triticum dicoccoides]|uniref:uncharacterized protein LOC119276140 isoform X2 n=1 Tax=Triticum dicoccoides TaxID=85692 RepID=UPI00188DFAE6|nr:uncharacterized protein LOC119276140 isoform X2 [Triticum dicoccoides]
MDVLALDLGDGGVDVERHPSGRSGAVPERRIWSNVVVLTVPCPATPRRRRRGVAASSCMKMENEREGQITAAIMDLNLLFLRCCSTGCSLAEKEHAQEKKDQEKALRTWDRCCWIWIWDLGPLLLHAPSGRRGSSLAPLDHCC